MNLIQLTFGSVLILQFYTGTLAAGPCPTGWLHHGNSCYFLHTHDTYSWMDAKVLCSTHNAHLAFVDDSAESTFLKGIITDRLHGVRTANVWLGATDEIVEGQFFWYATNFQPEMQVTFFDWAPNEPNSIGLHLIEDCLVAWANVAWKWADWDCHQKAYFVCEKSIEESGPHVVG